MRNKEGYYINKFDVIYVQGVVDGIFYRKSTRKKATKDNIRWIKRNHYDVLLKLIDNKKEKKVTLKNFGFMVLESTEWQRGKNWQRDCLSYFNNHILPYFQNYKIEEIKTSDIDLWQKKMLEKYSSSTTKKCKNVLSLILNKASADDLISKNYCNYTQKIKSTFEKKEPYNASELRLMLEHAEGWFKIFLGLIASTGIRPGEAIGLKWEDLDLNNNFIDLKRSISKGVIVDKESKTNTTKNHQRIVPIDPTMSKILANYFLKKQNETWVFVTQYNVKFYDARNINRYYFKPLLAKLNIKDRSMYATRHTFVSIMKNNGASDSWLKSVLGHNQSSKVLDNNYFTFNEDRHKTKSANNFFSHILKDEKEA